MHRRNLLTILCTLLVCFAVSARGAESPPNFIFVYVDNLGYGDIGCFGHPTHRTPNLDRMAAEGRKLTHFYSTSGVCTPSRASLMTGCYPRLRPISPNGLHPDEITVPEVLKSAGYTTHMIGKWHLGDQPVFLPTRQGFDSWLGIPYSDNAHKRPNRPHWPELPLMRGEKVIVQPVDPDTLTRRYTEDAIRFLREQAKAGTPFFLYLAQAMPGSTTAPASGPAFKGKSKNGPWGDSIEELDWSMGEILAALKELDLQDNTLVIWTSDNGAPKRNPPQGRNLPMGGWGYTTAEGGHRVPCIARWPGKIPAGSECAELTLTIDILPTFAALAGAEAPADRVIDGRGIWPLLAGEPGAESPHEAFYYYYLDQLQCVRSGKWKLHLPLEKRFTDLSRKNTSPSEAALYDVVTDPGETRNLIADHPEIVARLTALADQAREDLGDWDRPGKNTRPVGRIDGEPKPQLLEKEE
jgi:arylsulfatase A-like enzyme